MIPLLGKLYITSNSSVEKLQTAKDLAAEAIDMNIANDAASRNGLSKFHTAIVKVIGDSTTDKRQVNEETIVDIAQETKIEGADEDMNPQALKTDMVKTETMSDVQDSIVEELLAEDDDEVM